MNEVADGPRVAAVTVDAVDDRSLDAAQPGVERIDDPAQVETVRDDLIAGASSTVQITLPEGPTRGSRPRSPC